MNIIELANGYAIKIPYLLKDEFKACFKSAKWNKDEKQWEVGARHALAIKRGKLTKKP